MAKNNKTLVVLAMALMVQVANAQDRNTAQNSGLEFIQIAHENDFLFPIDNRDENYTGGARLDMLWQLPDRRHQNPQIRKYLVAGAGILAYTPLNIGTSAIQYNDRPFANFQYINVGMAFQRIRYPKQYMFDLSIGEMGRPNAGKAQSWIHEHITPNRAIPQGWNKQIAQGGGFTFLLRYQAERPMGSIKKNNANEFELTQPNIFQTIDIGAGNYMNYFCVGLSFTTGNSKYSINSGSLPSLTEDLVPPSNKDNKCYGASINPRIKMVFSNASLEGLPWGTNDGIYELGKAQTNFFVAEVQSSIWLKIGNHFQIQYKANLRTQEFHGGKMLHFYGGIHLQAINLSCRCR